MADTRRRIAAGLTIVWLTLAGSCAWADPAWTDSTRADAVTSTHALRIVSPYKGVWNIPPVIQDTDQALDAPLLGNGDVGVAILGRPDAMTFILSKNEFWSLTDGAVKAMARMNLAIGGLAGASYRMEQDISRAEVLGTFTLDGNTLQTTSWMQATDTKTNLFVTRFRYTGRSRQSATVSFSPGNGNEFPVRSGSTADVMYFEASADKVSQVSGYDTHKVRLATRVVGASGTISGNTLSFMLSPGRTYYVVTSVVSNYDTPSYQGAAIDNVRATNAAGLEELRASHETWWRTFYGKSFVEIGNKRLEQQWYGSLYLLASSARADEAAPGLWGNWIANTPAWHSDYTLNYNYEVPFLMALPTNHVELAKPYDKPILDWVPNAQAQAAENGWTGAYYRVHIGPLPNGSADLSTLNQKSLGAFAATNMIQRFYYTRDTAYANSVYGFLKQAALFWQNYLVFDGTRYVIVNDAQHEGDPEPQTNGIMSLGLVRFLLQGCIDISSQLNVDAELRSTWRNVLSRMSAFPTQSRNGQTVFRYTEVGRDWNDGNSIGIQHIYPASQIGLDSDPTLVQIARNTVAQMARWSDQNGTNTFYPAAARVGYDPGTILTQLDGWVAGNTYQNMYIHTGGGGVEGFNTVPATLAEMLVQSFQGKIRVFANWPSGTDAKFGDLLAYNNFLVSSEIRADAIRYVRFVSRGGLGLTFRNPWPGQTLALYRNSVAAGTLSGTDITIATATNEIIHVAPNGTSYRSILRAMVEPGPAGSPTDLSADSYQGVDHFLSLPAGRKMGSTSAVTVDAHGNIWVADRCGANSCAGSPLDPVMEFDSRGHFLRAFGRGLFIFPHGIFVEASGHVWVTDAQAADGKTTGARGNAVFEFDPDGKLLRTLGQSGKESLTFHLPSAVLVAPDGSIFIADGHDQGERYARILKLDRNGRVIKEWGENGSAPGQFDMPHALAMDSRGRLFVADRGNNRIQVFDQEGTLLTVWQQFGRPSGICIDQHDVLYASDSESRDAAGYGHHPGWPRGIRVGGAKNGQVMAFIRDPAADQEAEETTGGEGVAVDAQGNIYSAQVKEQNVVKYVRR